jgi:hypothetical protein
MLSCIRARCEATIEASRFNQNAPAIVPAFRSRAPILTVLWRSGVWLRRRKESHQNG